MNLKKIMIKEMQKSGGKATVVDVPENRRPTPESLQRLVSEISSQISANEAMRSKSLQTTSKMSCN